jgi:CheY-like chemotaxis protein
MRKPASRCVPMNMNRCHACNRNSQAGAERCEACGKALEAVATQPQPPHGFDKLASAGAIWLDDLTQPLPLAGPALTVASMPATLPELEITLLEIEAEAPVSAQRSAASAPTRADELILSDHEPRPRPAGVPPAAEVASQAARLDTAHAKLKAERRAAVRKSRLGGKSPADGASKVSEVLVFDPHEGERDRLRKLLLGFGFRVHAVCRADEAAAVAASHDFAAAFVDIALDAAGGAGGLELCRQIRAAGGRHGRADTLLVLTAALLKPMDRVRAELAGCEEIILKPVTRGSIAGVLDSRGIALPADRRQG